MKFYRQITSFFFCAPNWAKSCVGYREIFRRDTISRYQSQKFGIWIRILWYRMIWDMISRYIAICRSISHRITSKHEANTNSTRTHHLDAVYSCFFCFVSASSWLVLRLAFFVVLLLSISWTHVTGLTVPPANSNLVPSGLGLFPDRMFVLLHFSFSFSFLSPSFFLLDNTWYLVPGTP